MSDERLEDGWGPGAARADTLTRAGVESLADRMRLLARALGRTVEERDGWVAAALADSGMFSNVALLTRPPQDWSWVAAAVRSFAAAGVPRLLASPVPTPDLRADGLHLVGHPPFMVRAPGGDPPGPVDGLEVRRVVDPAGLRTFERTLIEGYPVDGMDPSAVPLLFGDGYLEGTSHAYVGYLGGEPVATAAAHVAAGVQHVEFVATRPLARGRGIGAALTWAATVSEPSLPAVLIASDDGRGVYEALGYLAVSRWTLWLAH